VIYFIVPRMYDNRGLCT